VTPADPHPERRLLLVVIDGLGADAMRRAIEAGGAPTLSAVLDAGGRLDDAISPFPSLTPVCLSTIATGAGPDRHRVPSLSWYHRGQRRFVEYGSSWAASRVEGWASTIEEVLLNLNHVHLAEEPRTLFEVVQDAGLEAACINNLIWRGRTRHTFKHDYGPLARVAKHAKVGAVYGPQHFIFSELYKSSGPRTPQIGIKRPRDWTGAHAARWLLRNTDAAFVLLYLGEHDVASHKFGPEETARAIRVADRAVGRVISGMGGIEAFREQCALVLCADHGQTAVEDGAYARLGDVFDDDVTLFRGSRLTNAEECDIAISPSNRVAMIYRLRDEAPSKRWIATRALESDGVDLTSFAEDGHLVVLRTGGAELRAIRGAEGALRTERSAITGDDHDMWLLEGDLDALDLRVDGDGVIHYGDYPDGLHRLDEAIRCINTGDVMVSATPGWEFVDIGGGMHPGGSHGSLHTIDSTAPLLTFGLEPGVPQLPLLRLSDVAGFAREHLRV
jgi:Type I phosphodiesterase / nucleotide pyrophosphatase